MYLPAGGAITLNASKLMLPAPAFWFDPRTGERREIGIGSETKPHFIAPDEQDWLLVIESKEHQNNKR